MSDHLGPKLSTKPMHMLWLLDVSGSMGKHGKIDALNQAMGDAVAAVKEAAAENPGVQVKVRVVIFAHDAEWHVEEPIDIEAFEWSDIAVVERGTTELGRAIGQATEAIREASTEGRGLPPAIILVSDGKPTDLKAPSFGASLRALAEEPWGRKASRMAIGIGQDADMDALARFIGHEEIEPLRAGNAEELSHYLRWASTVVVDEGTRPAADWRAAEEKQAGLQPVEEVEQERTVMPPPAAVDVDETAPPPAADVEEDATAAPPTTDVEDDRTEIPLEEQTRPPAPPSGPARTDLPPPGVTKPPPMTPDSDDSDVW